MSSRKGIYVRFSDEEKKIVEIKANEINMSLTEYCRKLLLEDKEPESINKYKFLDDGCELRDYLEEDEAPRKKGEGFYCMKKAPTLIKLGSGVDSAASKICSKCIIREGAKEYAVTKKKGIKLEMSRCTNGGYPSEDLSNMYCPKIGRYRPVERKKRKTDAIPCRLAGPNNANCKHLKRILIVKGMKEVEPNL